jgi:GNAT superfamily N-acetyltransferase
MRMDAISVRPATDADIDFSFRLHKASFREYVAEVWGWDEADQREIHDRNFDPGRVQIITEGGVEIGRLDIDDADGEIFIRLIELMPSHQGRGIGGDLIRSLLNRAAADGKRTALNVLAVNRRAHALYVRLGFTEERRVVDGPAVKIRMVAHS